ncbi:MAG: serine/threonine-protein kinase [Leptolyngbyaceae cyanobacterium bins.59]|nr:serine/threonine-protein kinase [Leptolyngbyaceae cyanobacterium bins.59]
MSVAVNRISHKPSEERTMLGQVLGERYEIREELGRQVGRRTFLAQDLQTQTPVVLKVLWLGEDFDWQELKLFQREGEILKSLSHPAIPRYLDYLEIKTPEKGFVLVQSYVEGRSLEQHLQTGRTFSEEEVRELAKALLEILMDLHRRQLPVIHRDLKPSNILLTNRSGNSVGQVYLVDFGSVQTLAAREGGTLTIVGTYGYMPPEQFGGQAYAASDLYSLGATLIYLVTGLHPAELPQQNLKIQFRSQVSLSPALADWLEWLTEPSLNRRVKSAQEALRALESTKSIRTLSQTTPPPPDSELLIEKKPHSLHIVFPGKGPTFRTIALLSLISPIIFWLILVGSTHLTFGIFAFLGLTLPVGVTIAVIASWIRQTHLSIENDRLTLTYSILGHTWNGFPPIQCHEIERLRVVNYYPGPQKQFVSLKTRLCIHTKQHPHGVNRPLQLSEAETYWLADELGEWLGVPVESTEILLEEVREWNPDRPEDQWR